MGAKSSSSLVLDDRSEDEHEARGRVGTAGASSNASRTAWSNGFIPALPVAYPSNPQDRPLADSLDIRFNIALSIVLAHYLHKSGDSQKPLNHLMSPMLRVGDIRSGEPPA